MPDNRTPHQRIADRLALAAESGTVYDQLVLTSQHHAYEDEERLQLRADREYNNGHIRTSYGSR